MALCLTSRSSSARQTAAASSTSFDASASVSALILASDCVPIETSAYRTSRKSASSMQLDKLRRWDSPAGAGYVAAPRARSISVSRRRGQRAGLELRSSRPGVPSLARRRCHLRAVRSLKPAVAGAGLRPGHLETWTRRSCRSQTTIQLFNSILPLPWTDLTSQRPLNARLLRRQRPVPRQVDSDFGPTLCAGDGLRMTAVGVANRLDNRQAQSGPPRVPRT